MPALDPNVCAANLGAYANKPVLLLRVQYRMHELEEPVTAMWMAKDLDAPLDQVSMAMLRLVKKGLAKRWQIHNHRSPVNWRNPKHRRHVLRRKGPVWVYEILQER